MKKTCVKFLISFILLFMQCFVTSPNTDDSSEFVFNGFSSEDLVLDGAAQINSSGKLQLTSNGNQELGHAFFPTPFSLLNSISGKPSSFSTTFIFAIVPQFPGISSEGLAFVISPSSNLSSGFPSQFLGLFNLTSNGKATNHMVAIEIDTVMNKEFNDINDNHVGIDVNSLISEAAAPAAYVSNESSLLQNLSLISGTPMRVWAEYNANNMEFNVTISPLNSSKPDIPLLSSFINLSSVFQSNMYVGFSASTGAAAGSHYILGWSFSLNGRAAELNESLLPSLSNAEPSLPETNSTKRNRKLLNYWVPAVVAVVFLILAFIVLILVLRKRRKFAEVSEEWEKEYFPQRFSYRELYKATAGFSDENLLGSGGFGEVYKGVLSKSKQEIAVKRISHDSKQGMKEFIAEIASIGRLRHRNLVQLLGYTRRRGSLILVYDFMSNGSLDKYLFNRAEQTLSWIQRFNIVKGIAAGLLYLHEEWEQVVLHRDIKASNVLLDSDFNGKLGDFGLARLHNRGSMANTTRVIGTLGYLAPELSRTGKSTTNSDVFAFGAFLLEVVCGKKPVELKSTGVELVLVDWVLDLMVKGKLIEARDRKLGDEFVVGEVETVLRLGLICSLPAAAARPSMRQVVQYLEGEASIRELTEEDLNMFYMNSMKDRSDARFWDSGGEAPADQEISGWDQRTGFLGR